MNLTIVNDLVAVSLSERNLRGLLAQWEASAGREAQILRQTGEGRLVVFVEPDSAHYQSDAREGAVRGEAGESREGQGYASFPSRRDLFRVDV